MTTAETLVLGLLLTVCSLAPGQGATPRPAAAALPPGAVQRLGRPILQHGGYLQALAFTGDGKGLISVGSAGSGSARNTGTVRLWSVPDGHEVRTLAEGLDGASLALVTLLADGVHVAIPRGGSLALVALATGQETGRMPLPAPDGAGQSTCLSPDGKLLASVSQSGDYRSGKIAIAVSSVADRKVVRNIDLQSVRLHMARMAFSPDSTRLAVGVSLAAAPSTRIDLYELSTGKPVFQVNGPIAIVTGLVFAPDGKVLAAIGPAGVTLHDARTGKAQASLPPLPGPQPVARCVAFSHDSRLAALGAADGGILVYDLVEKRAVAQPVCLTDIALCPDRSAAITVDSAGEVRLWPLGPGQGPRTLRQPTTAPASLALAAGGRRFAVQQEQGPVCVWDAATLKEVCRVKAEGTVVRFGLSADGRRLAMVCAGAAGKTVLREAEPPAGAAEAGTDFVLDSGTISEAAFSSDGGLAAVIAAQSVLVLARAAGQAQAFVQGQDNTGGVASGPVAVAPAGDLVAWIADGRTTVGEVASGKVVCHLSAAGGGDGAKPVDNAAGAVLIGGGWAPVGGAESYTALAFSSDGNMLAGAKQHQDAIVLWDLATGRVLGQFSGHRLAVRRLAFAADDTILASASADGTALLWDLKPLRPPPAPPQSARIDALWNDLGQDQPARACSAIFALVARPAEAVALLKDRLQPTPKPPADLPRRVEALIAQMDEGNYALRQKAYNDLLALGQLAAPYLRAALKRSPSLEVKTSLEKLLESAARPAAEGEDVLRALRAVTVLERIGNQPATTVVKALAEGADSRQTRAAKAALGRLAARP